MREIAKVDARSVSSDFGSGATRVQYREVPAQYTERQPFLYGLSGLDELRVANRRVHEPRYAK